MMRQSSYAGSVTLRTVPDSGRLVASAAAHTALRLEFPLYVTMPGTYTLWWRGNPAVTAGDLPTVGLAPGG